MEMKKLSDSTIKITIKLEDLEEYGMEIADFLVPQEKTEEFFYTILDELELPESFLDSGMLSFRVTPKPDRLDVFVTKSKLDKQLDFDDLPELPNMEEISQMSPDEFIKSLEKTIFEKSQEDVKAIDTLATVEEEEGLASEEEIPVEEKEQYIYYILRFSHLKEAVTFTQTINYPVDTSELYKMDGHYYLTILIDLENQPSRYPVWLLARMREHANDTDISRAVLQEHGHLLLVTDAVSSLRKVEC